MDADFRGVLEECFRIDDKCGVSLLRSYIYDIISDGAKFTQALSDNPNNNFLLWLDQSCRELPPLPNDNNFDKGTADNYYATVDQQIFKPLSGISDHNESMLALIVSRASQDDGVKEAIISSIIKDIFPKNDKADGYITGGYRTLVPADALRGALYVGNVQEVLEYDRAGESLLPDDIRTLSDTEYPPDRHFNYPKEMFRGMRSDWITGGPFTGDCRYSAAGRLIRDGVEFDLTFLPKTKYPQFGNYELEMIGCSRGELEGHIVVRPADTIAFNALRLEMQGAPPKMPAL